MVAALCTANDSASKRERCSVRMSRLSSCTELGMGVVLRTPTRLPGSPYAHRVVDGTGCLPGTSSHVRAGCGHKGIRRWALNQRAGALRARRWATGQSGAPANAVALVSGVSMPASDPSILIVRRQLGCGGSRGRPVIGDVSALGVELTASVE